MFTAVTQMLLAPLSGCAEHHEHDLPAHVDAGVPEPPASTLPCDVQGVLWDHCVGCHGAAPAGGASISLVSRELLLADSLERPGTPVIAVAIERMNGGSMPPAPLGRVAAGEVAILEAWLAAGTPEGSCGAEPRTRPDT
jgi:hypothetical protein